MWFNFISATYSAIFILAHVVCEINGELLLHQIILSKHVGWRSETLVHTEMWDKVQFKSILFSAQWYSAIAL